jgi:hypothetical protein
LERKSRAAGAELANAAVDSLGAELLITVPLLLYRLYTLDGMPVSGPADLQSMGQYVAVGGEVGGFKRIEYGLHRKPFNSSPKRDRR